MYTLAEISRPSPDGAHEIHTSMRTMRFLCLNTIGLLFLPYEINNRFNGFKPIGHLGLSYELDRDPIVLNHQNPTLSIPEKIN